MKLLNSSGIGAYGLQSDMSQPVDESSPADVNPNIFSSLICNEWELSTRPAEEAGVLVTHMRTGVVLDSRLGALPQLALPFRLLVGGSVGSGKQPFSWITLADCVRAIEFLAASNEGRGRVDAAKVNLVSPGAVSQGDLARALGKALGRPCWTWTPGIVMTAMYGSMATELILHGQNVRPTALQRAGFSFLHPDIDTALTSVFQN